MVDASIVSHPLPEQQPQHSKAQPPHGSASTPAAARQPQQQPQQLPARTRSSSAPAIPRLLSALALAFLAIAVTILSTRLPFLSASFRQAATKLSTTTSIASFASRSASASANQARTMSSGVTFQYRPTQTRGGDDHGWLKTLHTFSFASYYDPNFEQFGSLRVINEDRVQQGTGFPTHPHREAEIFSYVLAGTLAHKDSMGNVESMVRGDVQMTSGGTGIRHSEYNGGNDQVHFLQIWALPNARNLQPKYYARHFDDASKTDKWAHVVAPVGAPGVIDERDAKGPTPIHADLNFYATLLNPGKAIEKQVTPKTGGSPGDKLVYVQVVQSSGYNTGPAPKDGAHVKVELGGKEQVLGEGDGVFVRGAKTGDDVKVSNVGEKRAEVVLFEMDK